MGSEGAGRYCDAEPYAETLKAAGSSGEQRRPQPVAPPPITVRPARLSPRCREQGRTRLGDVEPRSGLGGRLGCSAVLGVCLATRSASSTRFVHFERRAHPHSRGDRVSRVTCASASCCHALGVTASARGRRRTGQPCILARIEPPLPVRDPEAWIARSFSCVA